MWRYVAFWKRTRESVEMMAQKMGFDAVAVSLSLDSITASTCHSGSSLR
jgi:hypothetical protein